MSPLNPKALEAAARAVWSAYADSPLDAEGMPGEPTDWREYGDIPEVMQARCRSYARSALFAYLEHLKSEGYGVVPREATEDEDETYEIGVRDGYEDAVQDLDIATGGDGEFKGSTLPGGTVDVPVMKQRIIDRFDSQIETLKFIGPGLLVLRNMCARAGLKLGEAKAKEMINAVRRELCEPDAAQERKP